MASARPPKTYSPSARTGRRSEGSGGDVWLDGVSALIRDVWTGRRPAPAGAGSNCRSWEPHFTYRHTRRQPARTSRRRGRARAATARPGADSRAAPRGASARAVGGAAVVLERLAGRGAGVLRAASRPASRLVQRPEPEHDASRRRSPPRPPFDTFPTLRPTAARQRGRGAATPTFQPNVGARRCLRESSAPTASSRGLHGPTCGNGVRTTPENPQSGGVCARNQAPQPHPRH